ncbi:MAG: CARDB domain-containing protein, partial [Anaerolineae bacterium]
HEAGYTASVAPGQKTLIRSTDSSGRSVTVEGTLYNDPLQGNYGLVNLDQVVTAWVDDEALSIDTTQTSEVATGDYELVQTPKQIVGSEVEVGDHTTNYQFDVTTADLNGDNRSEEIVAWRPSTVANAPIHLRIGGLPGQTNLLKSEPVAQTFNNKLYLFAQGYDDALWVGVDNKGFWQWQRCGGTLASGPAVTAISADTLKIVAVGTDGKLSQRTLSTSGATAWAEVSGQPSNTFEGTPALATDSTGTVHLFGRDTQNTVVHGQDTGSGFTSWQNLGGYLADGPDAIGFGTGKVMLMARGFDNALWYRQLNGSWSSWQTIASTSEAGMLQSAPASVSKATSTFEIYARTSDNGLSKLTFNGTSFGSWQTVAVDSTVGSRPAVLNSGSETIVYAAQPGNGVLQRSDAGAAWSQVNALAPGSNTTNTAVVPETSASSIALSSGYFLADGRAQLALATVNDQGQAVVYAYAAEGGFSLREIGEITLPLALTGPKHIALTTGDFDGDGTAEIAIASLFNPSQVSGTTYSVAEINIIRAENNELSLLSTYQSTVNLTGSSSQHKPSHVAITSGNFEGEGKQDLAVTYSYKDTGDSDAWSPVFTVVVDQDDFEMERDRFFIVQNHFSSTGTVDIAAGDMTGTDPDGIKRDEIIWGSPHESNSQLGQLRVLELSSANTSLVTKSSIVFDTNNLPYSLDAGDLDRDLKDEAALMLWLGNTTNKQLVTYDVTIDTGSNWSLNAIGRRNYPANSGNQYGVALAVGDVTGQSLRVGAPSYRLQQNVGNLIAIINAPPTHLDTVDGNPISIGVGEAGTYTRYSKTEGASTEISFDSKRSFSMALEAEITVGDPEGTHVTGSLGASYGSDFERGRTNLTEQTINQTLEATNDDFALFSGTSYQTWEYPLYADNSGVPATYINVVFPVPNSEAVYQGGQRSCDGWYLPTHEIHNIWSYTPLSQQNSLIGYSPSDSTTMYAGNVIAPGGGSSSWTFNMANNATNKYSSSVRLGRTAGLEVQIGGDSADVGVNVGVFSASKKVTAPSLKGTFNSEYSSSSTSSHTMQTFSDIEIETSFGGITSLEQFDVQSFLYWADGGYMVLDHTATPKAQGVWLGYDSADPAFRRPFAVDALCGPDKIDFSPEIMIDPPYAEIGERVTISAQVHNYSNVSANSVKVRFYLGDPDNGGTQIGSDQTISNLNRASGSQTVSIDWLAEGSGEQRIYAVIDPDNQLAEVHDEVSNTNNNKAYNLLTMAVTDFVDIGLAETQAYYPLKFGTVGTVGRAQAGDELTYSAHIALEGLEETLQFELAPNTGTLTAPTNLSFVGTPLELSAWNKSNSIQVDLTPAADTAPSVMQVNYPNSVQDSHVTVRRWNGASWVDAGCDGRTVDQLSDINQFVVPVCETGTYAVFSSETPIVITPYKLFLPVTLK